MQAKTLRSIFFQNIVKISAPVQKLPIYCINLQKNFIWWHNPFKYDFASDTLPHFAIFLLVVLALCIPSKMRQDLLAADQSTTKASIT
jgi:hypothetical protein